MTFSTYTRPAPTLTTSYKPLTPPRPFLALLPPPTESSSSLPKLLPLPPHLGSNHNPLPGYKLYRHSCTGAYPRSIDEAVLPEGSKPIDPLDDRFGSVTGKDSKDRRAQIAKTSEVACEVGSTARWRTKDELEGIRERPLYVAVNRFVREGIQQSDEEGATLVLCHGNGFNKEMWEETVRQVLKHVEGGGKIAGGNKVDEIWFVDHHNEGESYLLNRERIGSRVSWADCGRDLAALLYHSLPPTANSASPSTVPEHLVYDRNINLKNKRRKLIGIGHSVGGNAIVQCSHSFPNLFDSLILVDPMCRIIDETDATYGVDLVKSCIGRRNVWGSREEARTNLLNNPYFKVWHPRVFDAVIDHALVPLSAVSTTSHSPKEKEDSSGEGTVTLTTPRWMEAAMFTDYCGLTDGYDKMKHLREGMKVRFIMAGQTFSTGGPIRTHEMVLRPPTCDNVIIKQASHNVLQEHPQPLALQIYRALTDLPVEVDEKVYADKARL